MTERVWLHIGAMKTGTTFVQAQLKKNAKGLAEQGILYPTPWSAQVEGVRDVLELSGGYTLGSVEGAWAGLVGQVHAWPGAQAVLSMEFLSFAGAAGARRVVQSFAPTPVHVVLAGRDVGRALPAQWQTAVRNGRPWTYEDYLAKVAGSGRGKFAKHFWKRQDLGPMIRAWTDAGAAVTLVTVPPRGADPGLLWARLSQALGLAGVDLVLSEARNESLAPAAVELLRRVNEITTEQGMPSWVYQHAVNRDLSHKVLPGIVSGGSIAVPSHYHQWCVDESARIIADVRATGVPVVGDLEDLRPQLQPGSQALPAQTSAEEIARIAVAALAGLADVTGSRERERALQERGRGGGGEGGGKRGRHGRSRPGAAGEEAS